MNDQWPTENKKKNFRNAAALRYLSQQTHGVRTYRLLDYIGPVWSNCKLGVLLQPPGQVLHGRRHGPAHLGRGTGTRFKQVSSTPAPPPSTHAQIRAHGICMYSGRHVIFWIKDVGIKYFWGDKESLRSRPLPRLPSSRCVYWRQEPFLLLSKCLYPIY